MRDVSVREVHPELSFRAWNDGVPMAHSKRTAAGRAERRLRVAQWLGADLLTRARESAETGSHRKRDLADDDILDAVATLWTAHRIVDGRAVRLPDPPPRDALGLPMEIVY
jgi:predicted RNase H-like nuclease